MYRFGIKVVMCIRLEVTFQRIWFIPYDMAYENTWEDIRVKSLLANHMGLYEARSCLQDGIPLRYATRA